MDLCRVHVKGNDFLLRSSFSEKSDFWRSRYHSTDLEIRVSKADPLHGHCRYRSTLIKAMAKKSPGNSSDSNSNSSSSSGNNDHLKNGGDGLKGNNKSGDNSSNKYQPKPLDWREFRASLCIQEQAQHSIHQNRSPARPKPFPHKWAHPISSPENGCLLMATDKLDGVRTFERTVVLLLRSGTKKPQEGPYGVVINRPLNKKMKHMNSADIELATTFANCSLHFGGPLDASMFLLRSDESLRTQELEEVVPSLYFGSSSSLDEASVLVKKGSVGPHDFRFFMGYAGWQMDQLMEEIESDYWCVAACSANLILQNSSSDDLWGEILRLMGGRYSELSRKPKQDM